MRHRALRRGRGARGGAQGPDWLQKCPKNTPRKRGAIKITIGRQEKKQPEAIKQPRAARASTMSTQEQPRNVKSSQEQPSSHESPGSLGNRQEVSETAKSHQEQPKPFRGPVSGRSLDGVRKGRSRKGLPIACRPKDPPRQPYKPRLTLPVNEKPEPQNKSMPPGPYLQNPRQPRNPENTTRGGKTADTPRDSPQDSGNNLPQQLRPGQSQNKTTPPIRRPLARGATSCEIMSSLSAPLLYPSPGDQIFYVGSSASVRFRWFPSALSKSVCRPPWG